MRATFANGRGCSSRENLRKHAGFRPPPYNRTDSLYTVAADGVEKREDNTETQSTRRYAEKDDCGVTRAEELFLAAERGRLGTGVGFPEGIDSAGGEPVAVDGGPEDAAVHHG